MMMTSCITTVEFDDDAEYPCWSLYYRDTETGAYTDHEPIISRATGEVQIDPDVRPGAGCYAGSIRILAVEAEAGPNGHVAHTTYSS